MKGGISARQLRILLMIIMVLIVGAAVGSFVFVQKNISSYATAISSLNADAAAGDLNLQTLKRLDERLKSEGDNIANTRALLADESDYGDRVIDDITRIAKESNVTVSGFEFTDGASSATATQTQSTVVGGAPSGAPSVPGVTKKTVSVSINNPIPYNDLMKFLSKIETNKLQLQVSSVPMTKDKDNLVTTTQSFTIELYVRSKATT